MLTMSTFSRTMPVRANRPAFGVTEFGGYEAAISSMAKARTGKVPTAAIFGGTA